MTPHIFVALSLIIFFLWGAPSQTTLRLRYVTPTSPSCKSPLRPVTREWEVLPSHCRRENLIPRLSLQPSIPTKTSRCIPIQTPLAGSLSWWLPEQISCRFVTYCPLEITPQSIRTRFSGCGSRTAWKIGHGLKFPNRTGKGKSSSSWIYYC